MGDDLGTFIKSISIVVHEWLVMLGGLVHTGVLEIYFYSLLVQRVAPSHRRIRQILIRATVILEGALGVATAFFIWVVGVRLDALEILDGPKSLYLLEFVVEEVLVSCLSKNIGHRFVTQYLLLKLVAVDPEHLCFQGDAFDRARLICLEFFDYEWYLSENFARSVSGQFHLLPLNLLLSQIWNSGQAVHFVGEVGA